MTLHRPCPNGAPATKPTRKSTDRRTGDRRSTRIAHCTRRKSADRIAPASQTAIQVGMRQGSTQAFYRVTPKSPGNRRQRTDADRLQTMDHARAACMDASWRVVQHMARAATIMAICARPVGVTKSKRSIEPQPQVLVGAVPHVADVQATPTCGVSRRLRTPAKQQPIPVEDGVPP